MSTALYIAGFAVGLLVIIKSGNAFVDAAKWIAVKLNIPTFIVGATIVSIATTLPEILVSCIAAAHGSTQMASGNAIGSVTANTGLCMAITIVFMTVPVRRKELLIRGGIFLASIAVLWMSVLLHGAFRKEYALSLEGGCVLLLLFTVFIFENVRAAKKGSPDIESRQPAEGGTVLNAVKFIFALVGLAVSSRVLVVCGEYIATDILHVSKTTVALTIVAIGTSLPEAVTAICAVAKGEPNMSVGNVIGANIIDTALILPLCALISGGSITVPASVALIDMPVCLCFAAVAVIPAVFRGSFMKYQGVLMLIGYAAYIVYLWVSA